LASDIDWKEVLQGWAAVMIASGEFHKVGVIEGWTGFGPASESAIAVAERRLGTTLPESYKAFLRVSNGWWLQGRGGNAKSIRIWGTEDVQLMRDAQPETVDIWSEDVGLEEDPLDAAVIPRSHYRSVIQISNYDDGCYLLNPLIETGPADCQAAFFAYWVPGDWCYANFQVMMMRECEQYLAAHPKGREWIHLGEPPDESIFDPVEFVSELKRLGYFRFVDSARAHEMIADYVKIRAVFKGVLLPGPFPSPGATILTDDCGRVVRLDAESIANGRGRAAVAAVRPLLARAGVELGAVREIVIEKSYSLEVEGLPREFFRLRDGRPVMQNGDHALTVACAVIDETATLLNVVLGAKGRAERIATMTETRSESGGLIPAMVMLDSDEMAYLMMWSGSTHDFCKPRRPDL
jgi:hypothetical protein